MPKELEKENQIKESFQKVKEDISVLKKAINILSEEIEMQRNAIEELNECFKRTLIQAQESSRQTDRQVFPTDKPPLKAPKTENLPISTGNGGVPADRQTDRQTDRQVQKFALYTKLLPTSPTHQNPTQKIFTKEDKISQIEQVTNVLSSLDTLKKELRAKFKRLTQQEMAIFATIYQLEEEENSVDYSLLAQKLSLTESSIRDYIQKIIKKGIPVDKTKQNNKKITLSIPKEFRQIAPLDTILALREL